MYYYEHMIRKKAKFADLPDKHYSIGRIIFGPKPSLGPFSSFSSPC